MLTYVINTSDNKTFDSDLLFELSGYNKIRWLACPLNELGSCADEIGARQNVLGADDFRVAVIVDFYNFDRVRLPYGRRGFGRDDGVDLSLYLPYIEVYVLDSLVKRLEDMELHAAQLELFYVQNEKSERYELFENAEGQLSRILEGCPPSSAAAEESEAEPCDRCDQGGKSGCERDFKVGEVYCPEKQTRVWRTLLACAFCQTPPTDGESFPKVPDELQGVDKKGRAASALKGEVYPFELENDLRVGDYVKIVSEGKEDRYFTVEELYWEDGRPAGVLDSLKSHIFVRVPHKITEGDRLVKCEPMYTAFTLYCTKELSLKFSLTDYPYGATAMTFSQFYTAFRQRWSLKTDIRRHYYLTAYGGGPSRAALDLFSLSLCLIRMYEREENFSGEGDLEVPRLDASVLKEVLEQSWSRVIAAKQLAKKNNVEYYTLDQVGAASVSEASAESEPPPFDRPSAERLTVEELYAAVDDLARCTSEELARRNSERFNQIMSRYLVRRDSTRESDIKEEFRALSASGFLATTDQCPSKEDYEYYVNRKQQQISELFEDALAAEYIRVDYKQEKKEADEAYVKYKTAAACTKRSLIADIVLLILSVGSALLPYYLFQLRSFTVGPLSGSLLALIASGIFGGLFVLSALLQLIPRARRMRKAARALRSCYESCLKKEAYSFSAIRRRYESQLIAIEQTRYEMRQLRRLYEANMEKDRNVAVHHRTLEQLEDCLSGILNNLDVEPTLTEGEQVEDLFDLTRPIRARENGVYRVFSIEAIERMFPRKGDDR